MKKEIIKKKKFRFNFIDFLKDTYLYRLYSNIHDMIVMYKITKKNIVELEQYGFRINLIGQPYTVINLPEEIAQKEANIEPYIIVQLRKMDAIFLKYKLTELIYPEIEHITKPGKETEFEDAYLIVLRTNTEALSFWKFIGYTFKYFLIIFSVKIIISLIIKNTNIFFIILEFFKDYI